VSPFGLNRRVEAAIDFIVMLDVIADLDAEDDDGLGWSALSDTSDAGRVRPGAMRNVCEPINT